MAVQPGLCRTWSENPKTGFLTTRLICSVQVKPKVIKFKKKRVPTNLLFGRFLPFASNIFTDEVISLKTQISITKDGLIAPGKTIYHIHRTIKQQLLLIHC